MSFSKLVEKQTNQNQGQFQGQNQGQISRPSYQRRYHPFSFFGNDFDLDFPSSSNFQIVAPRSDFTPLVDVFEDEKHLQVVADLPGIRKDDIKVRIDNGVLTLEGDKRQEFEEKGTTFHRVEVTHLPPLKSLTPFIENLCLFDFSMDLHANFLLFRDTEGASSEAFSFQSTLIQTPSRQSSKTESFRSPSTREPSSLLTRSGTSTSTNLSFLSLSSKGKKEN